MAVRVNASAGAGYNGSYGLEAGSITFNAGTIELQGETKAYRSRRANKESDVKNNSNFQESNN